MKVALVSAYMLESTMPLAKYMDKENVDVYLYAIMPQYNQNVFVVDFSNNKQPNGFINGDVLNHNLGVKLCEYLAEIKTKFFVFPAGSGKSTFFSDIYYAWKFSMHLISNNFDVIHLIHSGNRFSILLMHFLKKQNLVQTLHEVTGHSGNTNSYDLKILNRLVRFNIPVIFHSNISKERFLKFRSTVTGADFDKRLYAMVRFGLYETYKLFSPENSKCVFRSINNNIPIILHLGRIVPYKGIDILIDAIKIVQKNQPVHLIVAGGGESYFSFDGIDSYEFTNRTISNEEIIHLINKCLVVVCPYRSASQSGIPMTVYPFNKPIIASNIGGFKEIIDHNETGLVVDQIDAVSFADAIQNLISNKDLRLNIAKNIEKKFTEGEFSWTNIAKETICFYKYHLPLK